MVPSAAAWCYLQQVHYNAFQWGANLSLVTLPFKFVWPRDQIRLPCKLGANLFTGSGDISFSNKQTNKSQTAQNNQNLTQFAVCGKNHWAIRSSLRRSLWNRITLTHSQTHRYHCWVAEICQSCLTLWSCCHVGRGSCPPRPLGSVCRTSQTDSAERTADCAPTLCSVYSTAAPAYTPHHSITSSDHFTLHYLLHIISAYSRLSPANLYTVLMTQHKFYIE